MPFYTADGRLEGVLGMDMSAADVLAYERKYQLGVVVLCLLVTALVLPIGIGVGTDG